MAVTTYLKAIAVTAIFGLSTSAHAHGDVTPQGVETGDLPELGEEPLETNPFRKGNKHGDFYEEAVKIGEEGYAGNCAQCHGIRAMSGGLTPDLRELREWDDAYYIGRVMNGTERGMPAWEGKMDQNAMWAIKTYVESVAEDE